MASPGATDSQIGKSLGLSRVQVSRRKNSQTFENLIRKHIQDAMKPLLLAQVKAVRRLCEAMDSSNERIALQACQIVLDRAPVEAFEKEHKKLDNFSGIQAVLDRMARESQNNTEKEKNFKEFGLQMTNKELEEVQRRKKSENLV